MQVVKRVTGARAGPPRPESGRFQADALLPPLHPCPHPPVPPHPTLPARIDPARPSEAGRRQRRAAAAPTHLDFFQGLVRLPVVLLDLWRRQGGEGQEARDRRGEGGWVGSAAAAAASHGGSGRRMLKAAAVLCVASQAPPPTHQRFERTVTAQPLATGRHPPTCVSSASVSWCSMLSSSWPVKGPLTRPRPLFSSHT